MVGGSFTAVKSRYTLTGASACNPCPSFAVTLKASIPLPARFCSGCQNTWSVALTVSCTPARNSFQEVLSAPMYSVCSAGTLPITISSISSSTSSALVRSISSVNVSLTRLSSSAVGYGTVFSLSVGASLTGVTLPLTMAVSLDSNPSLSIPFIENARTTPLRFSGGNQKA